MLSTSGGGPSSMDVWRFWFCKFFRNFHIFLLRRLLAQQWFF